jgi:cytochrome c oxidase cbb3-type subunit I
MHPEASTAPSPGAPPGLPEAPPEEIDRSARFPLLLMLVPSVKWAVLGLLLLGLGGLQLAFPDLFRGMAWLTYGRVQSAGMSALVYGFGIQSGLAALFWVVARLGRAPIRFPVYITFGQTLWNLGVLAGVVGILAGHASGFHWVEVPRYAGLLMLLGYLLLALLLLLNFFQRRARETYVSHWYAFGSVFWFGWSFTTVQLVLHREEIPGAAQAVLHAWYAGNLFFLWFLPVTLALVFYFVPKLLERPLFSRHLAVFGFWTLALFAPLTGMVLYAHGPLPVWLQSLSVVSSGLLLVPLTAVIWNYVMTVRGTRPEWRQSPVLPFFGAAMLVVTVHGILYLAGAFRLSSSYLQFTPYTEGLGLLALLGFFPLALFGAVYYMAPRLAGIPWPRPGWIRLQLALHLAGLALLLLAKAVGGVVHGFALENPDLPFMQVLDRLLPFLKLQSVGLLGIFASLLLFAAGLGRLVLASLFGWARRAEILSGPVRAQSAGVPS